MDRKEAIEVVKKNYPHVAASGSEFETALRELVPELAESEGERIRKMLVEQMERWKKCAEDNNVEQDVKDASAAIAWLERQKEKQPAEKQDYSGLNDLERAILRGFLAAGIENVPVGIIQDTAYECIGFLALLDDKPAEWSDEDENNLVSVLWHVSNSITNRKRSGCHCDLTDWLKNLRERIKFLRPQHNLRWRRAKAGENIPESIILSDGDNPRFGKCAVRDSYYIPISELEELPKE